VPILSSHTLYQSQCELEPEILYRQTKGACNSLMFPQLAGMGTLCGGTKTSAPASLLEYLSVLKKQNIRADK
jgi:hypothetical protein